MPPASHLTDVTQNVRAVFASGTAELNRAMLESFATLRPELPLIVIAEFEPQASNIKISEWIAWHVHRPLAQNLESVRAALKGRRIVSAVTAWDRRSALADLRSAAYELSPGVVIAYDEDLRSAPPQQLGGFLRKRRLRAIAAQFREGGRARARLRRLAHPAEAEIPVRARTAQLLGILLNRLRSPEDHAAHSEPSGLQEGVSVIVPSRDGIELLRTMLPPLLPQIIAGEVIIVDNGSSDGTADWLSREYPQLRVIANPAALSFAAAVNLGLRSAAFRRTLLLNNDMVVEPRFIAALEAAFVKTPDLFCSTAQILFPPGVRREETGKAVWRAPERLESPLDFPLRCDDPIEGEDGTWVLYGSGGCSLFDTAKLAALGGVSESYRPAYVEDLDLGFRAWKRGWASVYCAGARVEHRHRSTTSRFYTERQIDFFTERNFLRFLGHAISDSALFERLWRTSIRRLQLLAMRNNTAALDTLRAVPAPGRRPCLPEGLLNEEEILALGNGDVAIFPGTAPAREKTILIASPYLPFPLSHGGAVRIYNLMKPAAAEQSLILVAFCDDLAAPPAELLAICTQIVLVRRHGSHYRRDTPRPDVVEEFDSPVFHACLKQAVHQWRPEIVQLEFTWMAQYARDCAPARTILVEHDITFDLQQQLAAIQPPDAAGALEVKQQLEKWRAFETSAWKTVDCVVTMSEKDKAVVTGAPSVVCLPNGVDCERFQPGNSEPETKRMLLIGSFAHLPNLLALEFLLCNVWPLLGSGYTLHVIGGSKHDYYLDFFRDRVKIDLNQPGIEVEGFVSDVRSAYHRATVVLAPLTASAGTNIKVLEAAAMGKAIVSTAAGMNGIDFAPSRDFLLSRDAPEMADQIAALCLDPDACRTIERNAREAALRFDWSEIGHKQQDLYNTLSLSDESRT